MIDIHVHFWNKKTGKLQTNDVFLLLIAQFYRALVTLSAKGILIRIIFGISEDLVR